MEWLGELVHNSLISLKWCALTHSSWSCRHVVIVTIPAFVGLENQVVAGDAKEVGLDLPEHQPRFTKTLSPPSSAYLPRQIKTGELTIPSVAMIDAVATRSSSNWMHASRPIIYPDMCPLT